MSFPRCGRCFAQVASVDEDTGLCSVCTKARSAKVSPLDVEATFGPSGPLAAGNPHYEARPGQVHLARAIHDALVDGHHLLAEGPCGIGKSKAYGIPAAHLARAGKRVLIVTASIALQEQLIMKDLPAISREFGEFTFAMLKGRSNYLCVEQAASAGDEGLSGDDAAAFDVVSTWAKATKTGDKSELLIKPSDLVWRRFSISTDECPKRKCPSFEVCHATKARERASSAGVLVTNYHLFFLDLASGGQILPSCDVVILDEAHEAADIARDLLGSRVSRGSFERIAKAAKETNGKLGERIRTEAAAFFDRLLRFHDSDHYSKIIRWPLPIDPSGLVEATADFVRDNAKHHLAESALRLAGTVEACVSVKDPDCVYSIEVKESVRGRHAALVSRYVHPGGYLARNMWPKYKSIVAVSATLTTDGKFDFVRRELGAPDAAREVVVDTPFDFRAQALLVVPPSTEVPEPSDPRFLDVAALLVIRTIEACGGRTLGLFTSYRALNNIYERVKQAFPELTVLRQGDAPTTVLVQRFKEDTRSVLLGTTSLWTGVDVPGEALTGLVIDKLPFGSPDDPVALRIAETDRGAFGSFTVPKSILVLRQGVGRLIRSRRDVGAVVILDRRLSTKGYGKRFERSLPAMQRATSTAQIASFLRARGVPA